MLKSPVDIVTDVYQALTKANHDQPWSGSPSPSDWQRFRLDFKWQGKPLNEWQLWGLLRATGYSEECVTMLSHAIGFEGPFLSLVNAGEAFQILEDFPKDRKYFTFKKGYSTLPNKLCSLIETLGGKVYPSTNVESIHKDADGFRLELTQAPAGDSSSRFVKGGVQASL
jgi:hypothetical protein